MDHVMIAMYCPRCLHIIASGDLTKGTLTLWVKDVGKVVLTPNDIWMVVPRFCPFCGEPFKSVDDYSRIGEGLVFGGEGSGILPKGQETVKQGGDRGRVGETA
ncbi:MAG: hypothetical protein DRO12_02485 [Thermoprotei archaeon]|nr:MAG: hypothetical protein DRO12_02485 [Thermoprotei archaeon]